MPKLVIVESPTKAKTIGSYLPKDYIVRASMGHIRDLPASAAEIPPKYKGEPWSRLGVNVEADFEPLYVIPDKKKKVVGELREAVKKADEVILATDEDREGESIGWHLHEVLNPKQPVRRMVFHEITREAIAAALADDARDRHGPGAGTRDAAHPRPAGGLHRLTPAVAQDRTPLVGRPRAERGRAPAGAARARTPRLCHRPVLGPAARC